MLNNTRILRESCSFFSSYPKQLVTSTRDTLPPSSTYQINWHLSLAIYVSYLCVLCPLLDSGLRVGTELYTTLHRQCGHPEGRGTVLWEATGVEV